MELLGIITDCTTEFLLKTLKDLQVKYFYLLSRSPPHEDVINQIKGNKRRTYLLVLDTDIDPEVSELSRITTMEALIKSFDTKPFITFAVSTIISVPHTDFNFYIKVNPSNCKDTAELLNESAFGKFYKLIVADDNQLFYRFNGDTTPELRAKVVEAITWMSYPFGSDRFITKARARDASITIKTERKKKYLPYLEAEKRENNLSS